MQKIMYKNHVGDFPSLKIINQCTLTENYAGARTDKLYNDFFYEYVCTY